MWRVSGPITEIQKNFLCYRIATYPGCSGSPVFKREQGRETIIGIHIAGDDNIKRNIALRLTKNKRKVINGWVGEAARKLDLSTFAITKKAFSVILSISEIF